MNQRGLTRIAAAVIGLAVGIGWFADGAAAANNAKQQKQQERRQARLQALRAANGGTPATPAAGSANAKLVDPVAAALAVTRAQAEQRAREKANARSADKIAPSLAPAPIAPVPSASAPSVASTAVASTAASAVASASAPVSGGYSSAASAAGVPPTQIVKLPPVTRADKARDPKSVAAEIDRLIDAKLAENKVPVSSVADDSEFARRAYVDITGKTPSASSIDAFLRDSSANKRAALIDRLLASPDFGNHQAAIWRELLIPSDTMAKVPTTVPLTDWLAKNINAGRGWDQTVRMLLTAEGSTSESPAAIFFVAHGDNKNYPQADVLTRTVTSAFMGTQLQCAQCHEHPFDKRWKQEDFWGVAAFFGRVENKAAGAKGAAKGGQAVIVESIRQGGPANKGKPAARLGPGDSIIIPPDSFTNVGKVMPAKYPGGATAALGGVPALRPAFAAWLTDANNPYFAQTMANRMWAQLMGHGIVNPLDDFNPAENQPTHPELLATLSREFAASGFDLKHLVRSICASKTYGRSAVPVEGNKLDNKWFARVDVKVMSPEVLADSLAVAMEDSTLKVDVSGVRRIKGGGPPARTPRDHFVRFFKPAGDGIEATDYAYGVPQALLLMNQVAFNAGSPVIDRAMKNAKPEAVEQLYLAALGRKPTAAEVREAVGFVEKAKTIKEGLSGVMWSLVNRSEFVLNH